MLERRRIFKGRKARSRFGGAALVVSAVIAAPLVLGVALPSSLFGSAPTDRNWRAEAHAIRIVDGETIGLGERIVRLDGVAAPARGEACRAPTGETFDCGGASAAALTRLVAGRPVACRIVGQDGFGRGLGQCDAGGADLNQALVSGGFAIATGSALRGQESVARQAALGLWANGVGAPAAWRARN
ncbi:thermonuclease family protein [Roseomonas rosulenta]|uniref:thermonuclease family protein n=1 Tax=Roseomonas rosulenta TaxID=2748667 RepID=UPI0018DF6196